MFDSRTCISTSIHIFLLFLFAQANASNWIDESIELSINTRFVEAETLIESRIAIGDSTAEEYFFLASVLNSKMTHFENRADQKKFEKAINKVIALTNKNLKQEKTSDQFCALQYFYRGSAYGFLAFSQGQNNEWLDALNNGMQSIEDLRQAIALDSTLYDAYLGIGVYQYWRSTKLKFLFWMPLIEDKREEGLENIRIAVQKSTHSRYMAMHQLIYILLNYGLFDEAVPLANEVVAKFPQSTFMWWAYGHTWYKRHEYDKALQAYQQLLHLLKTLPEQNPSHVVTCLARLAEIYSKTGREELCAQYAQNAINYAATIQLTDPGKKSLEKAKRLLDDPASEKHP